jgi:hypothetical protein
MQRQDESRKLRSDLTPAERERLEKYGSLEFKSPRDASRMLIRVKYAGIGPDGRAA